jgi:hypothetical protein
LMFNEKYLEPTGFHQHVIAGRLCSTPGMWTKLVQRTTS